MPKALPLSNWVKMGEFDDFLIEFTKFFVVFEKTGPVKDIVPDPVCLLERFCSIPTGRSLLNKLLIFKIENFGI